MDSSSSSSSSSILKLLITVVFFFFAIVPSSHCNSNKEEYEVHFHKCSRQFECGNLKSISYPFWGGGRPPFCGYSHLKLECRDNQYAVINNADLEFRVLGIDQPRRTMTLARSDLWDDNNDLCHLSGGSGGGILKNTSFRYEAFKYPLGTRNLTISYGCPVIPLSPLPEGLRSSVNNVTCDGGRQVYYFADDFVLSHLEPSLTACNGTFQVPILADALDKTLSGINEVREVLKQGFVVEYIANRVTCDPLYCPHENPSSLKRSVAEENPSSLKRSIAEAPVAEGHRYWTANIVENPSSLQAPEGLRYWTTNVAENPSAEAPVADGDAYWTPYDSSKRTFEVAIGVAVAAIMILLTCAIIYRFRTKFLSTMFRTKIFSKTFRTTIDEEGFIRGFGQLQIQRYRFSDIKKMTSSFKKKLGQGGYGGVYRGKLLDGRLVAVKVLNTTKGNGEEFVNEVASISRTSHVNIVTLLGFCLQGSKRALIYEFMPNGSLEKFIYNDNHLGWEKLFQIATGIARGLEYLHRGCSTRIVHFDIKPHNILLDEDFCPKISDFGLSKLCTRKESIISTMDARGTIGYIAPEVFSRNFGGVSHKSDVYSYGMMILEMVGGRKNIEVGVSKTSEIYFPRWIYEQIELGNNLRLQEVKTPEEDEVSRKMILVGLWCIQTNPSDRPAISKVIEMLEGSLEALHIPPKPFLSTPKSPEESLTTASTS